MILKYSGGGGYWLMRLRLKAMELGLYLRFSSLEKKWTRRLGLDYYAQNGFIYYLTDSQIAYIEIPKVMSTSIKQSFLKEETDQVHRTFSRSLSVKIEVANPEEYPIFTFVRNPFSRLVSCYQDRVLKSKQLHRKGEVFLRYLDGFLYDSKDFADFVQRISVIPACLQDRHFKSQYTIIYEDSLKPIGRDEPDFIGHMENIGQDWSVLQEQYHLSNLPRRNVSEQAKGKKDWRDYYDEKTAKLVYRLYKKDIESFGYEEAYQDLLAYLKTKAK